MPKAPLVSMVDEMILSISAEFPPEEAIPTETLAGRKFDGTKLLCAKLPVVPDWIYITTVTIPAL